MPAKIHLTVSDVTLSAELNDSPSAAAVLQKLPLEFDMHRWGEEYYGDAGIFVKEAPDARTEMEVGELAVWPSGKAICIFFGPTPVSQGDEPRAVSPVNPIGRLLDDPSPLNSLGSSIRMKLSQA